MPRERKPRLYYSQRAVKFNTPALRAIHGMSLDGPAPVARNAIAECFPNGVLFVRLAHYHETPSKLDANSIRISTVERGTTTARLIHWMNIYGYKDGKSYPVEVANGGIWIKPTPES